MTSQTGKQTITVNILPGTSKVKKSRQRNLLS